MGVVWRGTHAVQQVPVAVKFLTAEAARDPLCQQLLEAEDFHWLGKTLADLDLPTLSVLEGGYSDDLPELILAYLRGVAGLPLQAIDRAVAVGTDEHIDGKSDWELGDLLK